MTERKTVRMLVVVAHGSRREASNAEVVALADRLRLQAGAIFSDVVAGFLEIASPSIPDALEHCAAQGATEIVVFPHFLAAGRHVATDIPGEVAIFAAAHPNIAVTVAPHLGVSALLPQAILALAAPAGA